MTSQHSGNEAGREASELVIGLLVSYTPASHTLRLDFYSAVSRSLR